ncbi:hypothetical protein D3C85_1755550 [compost metagenome]
MPEAVEVTPVGGVKVAEKVTITGELLSSLLEQEIPIKSRNKNAENLIRAFIIIFFLN